MLHAAVQLSQHKTIEPGRERNVQVPKDSKRNFKRPPRRYACTASPFRNAQPAKSKFTAKWRKMTHPNTETTRLQRAAGDWANGKDADRW